MGMKNPIETGSLIIRRLTRAFFAATLTLALLHGKVHAEEPGSRMVHNTELHREGFSGNSQVDMNILNDAKDNNGIRKNPAEFIIGVENGPYPSRESLLRQGILHNPAGAMFVAVDALRDDIVPAVIQADDVH